MSSHDLALRWGIPVAGGAGVASTVIASSCIVLFDEIAASLALTASTSTGVAGGTAAGYSAVAIGIGAVIGVVAAVAAVGYSASWTRDDVKEEACKAVTENLVNNKETRSTFETAALAAYANFCRDCLENVVELASN